MCAPRYQDIAPERIPEVEPLPGAKVRVLAGEYGGVRGPVDAEATSPLYLDIALPAGAVLEVPVPQPATPPSPMFSRVRRCWPASRSAPM
jgi:quercetin 2,3-dioxygenase